MSANGQLRLAIYGKGGIGKSTVAANLAAAFATAGRRVLQIGCDPKHDSTRLLLGGRRIATVLEFLENPATQNGWFALRRQALSPGSTVQEVLAAGKGLPTGLSQEAILHRGYCGIACVEAGGPVPGVGCGGRGILSTFELLEKLAVDMNQFDVVLYDVLGDVVCGGFGVPLRDPYANRILLVTSEVYLSLYAAYNIVRGVANYQRTHHRLVGRLLNRRANDSALEPVARFSAANGPPVIGQLPRSPVIRAAERLEQTVIEAFPESDEARRFQALAERLATGPTFPAVAMDDEQLERVVLQRTPAAMHHEIPRTAAPGISREAAINKEPLRVAIYGKGGIGKSTIAANLAAALARAGKRVVQIGCDPKHDSTRTLLGGRPVRTVLEYLQEPDGHARSLDQVIHTGAHGVHCIEVGGPQPGVGCAGRGILSAFTLLEKLGFDESQYDVILYDVLGDIVCGGFAIPLRNDFAQAVLLVSSEEFMPIYAANTILLGINNVSGLARRVFGIFFNARDNHAPPRPVEAFAQAVGLPIVARLKRSPQIQAAEQAGQPLACLFPHSEERRTFDALAAALLAGPALHVPRPLLGENLERVVIHDQTPAPQTPAGGECRAGHCPGGSTSGTFTRGMDLKFTTIEAPPADPFYYRRKPIRLPVWECAFHGAVLIALKLRDAVVVAHSPVSCTHMRRLEACGVSTQIVRKRKGFYPDPMVPNLVCTNMTEKELVYGGTEALSRTLGEVLQRRPPVVFVVTSCAPAMIGDHYAEAIRAAQPVSPETRIVLLRSDGNLTGGGLNGMLSCLFDGFLSLTAKQGPTIERSVNLVMDWDYEDSRRVEELLGRIGLTINARFTDGYRDATVADLQRFPQARLTLLCARNFLTDFIRKHMEEIGSGVIARHTFPRGFRETEVWLREIGAFFGIEARVEELLAPERERYLAAMVACRPVLQGKRIVLFTRGQPVDEIIDAALDTGMEVVLVGVMSREEDCLFRTRHANRVPVRFSLHPDERLHIVRRERIDAVFTMTQHDLPPEVVFLDTVGAYHAGFGTCAELARRWVRLFQAPLHEGWRRDFTRLCPAGAPTFPQVGEGVK